MIARGGRIRTAEVVEERMKLDAEMRDEREAEPVGKHSRYSHSEHIPTGKRDRRTS